MALKPIFFFVCLFAVLVIYMVLKNIRAYTENLLSFKKRTAIQVQMESTSVKPGVSLQVYSSPC